MLSGTGIGLEVSTAPNEKQNTKHVEELGSPDFLRPCQQRLSDFSNDSTASGSTSVNDQSSNLFGDPAWPGPDQNQLFSQASIFDQAFITNFESPFTANLSSNQTNLPTDSTSGNR